MRIRSGDGEIKIYIANSQGRVRGPTIRRVLHCFMNLTEKAQFLLLQASFYTSLSLDDVSSLPDDARDVFQSLHKRVEAYIDGAKDMSSHVHDTPLEKLIDGIACLSRFISLNFVGPCPKWLEKPSNESDGSNLLALDGEEALSIRRERLLVKATMLFDGLRDDDIPTACWWRARAALCHQRVLENNVPTLRERVFQNYDYAMEVLDLFPSEIDVKALLSVEIAQAAMQFHEFGRAHACLRNAKALRAMSIESDGAMGKRTMFQEKSNAQFVIKVKATPFASLTEISYPKSIKLDSDLLFETPVLDEQGTEQIYRLAVLDQAIVLNEALLAAASDVDKELNRHKVLAYVNKIIEQPTIYALHFNALFQRSMLESKSSHHQSRSFEQLEELERAFGSTSEEDSLVTRSWGYFLAPLLCYRDFGKAYASFCESILMFQAALRIYQRLELWEPVMLCLAQVGQKSKAIQMLEQKITVEPSPLYFCILGDLKNDATLYREAWSISKETCSRAKRTLGERFFRVEKYAECIPEFQAALKINPLFPKAWFMLGYAAMQVLDWNTAAGAFSRVVAQDPNDGQAWNNLAAVYLHLKQTDSAFLALKQGVRFRRGEWKVWDNYLTCALDLEKYQEAIEAMEHLVNIRGVKNVDLTAVQQICAHCTESFLKDPKNESTQFLITACTNMLDHIAARLPTDTAFWNVRGALLSLTHRYQSALESYLRLASLLIEKTWSETDSFKMELQSLLIALKECNAGLNTEKARYSVTTVLDNLQSRSEASRTITLSQLIAETQRAILENH